MHRVKTPTFDRPMQAEDKNWILKSVAFPALLVGLMALIHYLILENNFDKRILALVPREWSQIHGIITAHFIHADWGHFGNNAVPLFVLGSGVSYFFKKDKWKIYTLSLLITGVWTWAFARPSYHLGASGLVYAWAGFLFISGVLRKSPPMYALSFLIIFLYGSMIWGIFPIDYKISWESHLLGGLSGLLLGWYYRDKGPKPPKYSWEIEEEIQKNDIEVEYEELTTNKESEQLPAFTYIFKPTKR